MPAQRPRVLLGDRFQEWATATPTRSAILIAYLALAKQVTCSPILLPLFHRPANESSPSDGALDREPSVVAILPSRSTWRRIEDATVEPRPDAGTGDVIGSFAL